MIVTCVSVSVKKENVGEFIKETIKNHEGTRKEPGNLRFDVLQCAGDETEFILYEVFESREAVNAHKETQHYKNWKETVEKWMTKPRKGIVYNIITPEDKNQW
ncbi:MAG: antibiotic biosynthesis monooxygenase [Elusimicrobia bacterium]|nr:antibiotic biosynthesis monooxygenase [Candidatus Liberimonas magnetica]